MALSINSVIDAADLIKNKVVRTPVELFENACWSTILDPTDEINSHQIPLKLDIFLKFENLQRTRSFKFRGASYFLAKLSDAELRKGVVTYSTGNHAQAVALAAMLAAKQRGFQVPAHVVVPKSSPPCKYEPAMDYGAQVSFADSMQEACEMARSIEETTGATFIPPADHEHIVLGQGTAMLEFQEQVADLDTVIVPSAGGGLLTGTALVCRNLPIKVFGAEPVIGGAQLAAGIARNERVKFVTSCGIADGLRSPVGESNWKIVSNPEYVEGVYTVTEKQIREAMRLLIEKTGFLIEPSSAVALAVVLGNHAFRQRLAQEKLNWNIGIIVTGGNTSLAQIARIFA